MSLQLVQLAPPAEQQQQPPPPPPARALAGATAAVVCGTRIVVGTDAGALRVLGRADYVLERELRAVPSAAPSAAAAVRRRAPPVDLLAAIPHTDLVAAVAGGRCALHDLHTRRVVHEFDSSSARTAVAATTSAGAPRLLVGSKYKLRVFDPRAAAKQAAGKAAGKAAVVDTPGGQRLRAVAALRAGAAVVAIGSGAAPRLYTLDLDRDPPVLRPLAALPQGLFGSGSNAGGSNGGSSNASGSNASGSRQLSLAVAPERPAQSAAVLIACSAGSAVLCLNPLRLVAVKAPAPISAVSLVARPTGVPLFVTASHSELCVLSPATGTVIRTQTLPSTQRVAGITAVSASTALVLLQPAAAAAAAAVVGPASASALAELQVRLPVSAIAALDRSEAAAFALAMDDGGDASDAEDASAAASELSGLRALQSDEAAALFREQRIDESMRLFTRIEELGAAVCTLDTALPLVEERLDADEGGAGGSVGDNGGSVGDNGGSRSVSGSSSSQASLFSVRSSRAQHPLDPVAAYLAFMRRKLRRFDDRFGDDRARVDTALFRCYLLMRSPLVAPLLRSANNACDAGVVRARLLDAGKWRELVWFLRSRGEHDAALELLRAHSEPPEHIAAYLERLVDVSVSGGDDAGDGSAALDVVFRHAAETLRGRPDLAASVFFDHAFNGPGTASAVYGFLETSVGAATAREFAFARVAAGDETPRLHNAVAVALARGEQPKNLGGSGGGGGGGSLGSLERFVKTSRFIQPRALLNLPGGLPYACESLLYERLGEFKAAVDVCVGAGDIRAATRCAESHGLALYLFDRLPAAADRIEFLRCVGADSGLAIGAVLPQLRDANVRDVGSFLERFVQAADDRLNRAALSDAVNRAALAECTVALNARTKTRHDIAASDACSLCHKRLGRAITAISNAGERSHYACYINSRRA